MGTILLIIVAVINYVLIGYIVKFSERAAYYRGRRDSYQQMLDDINAWRVKHPGMDINDYWENAVFGDYKRHIERTERNADN